MSRTRPLLQPLAERLHDGQIVFTHEQAIDLTKKIMAMTTVENATVSVRHSVRHITRLASGNVRSTDVGERLRITLRTENAQGPQAVSVQINQLEEDSLKDMVVRADTLLNAMIGTNEKIAVEYHDEQDTYQPDHLWHAQTAAAIGTAHESVVSQVAPQIIDAARRQRGSGGPFNASGFVGLYASAEAVLTTRGITAYSNETDSEVSVTVRPMDGKASGWQGQAHRDWRRLDPAKVATEAADIAARSVNPSALEPGRRTAILGSGAVIQLMRFLVPHFNGFISDIGGTAFSKVPRESRGSRWEQQIFDPRVQITSDPSDFESGYPAWFDRGYANPPMTWIAHGRLRNLAYHPGQALAIGKPYSELPFSLRFHGGDVSADDMIAQCQDGVYVHRVADVDVVDMNTGMMTGVTRDGCFLVRKGRMERPIKNFRFWVSPFFFLNALLAIGPTQRAAFGYAPPTRREMESTGKGYDFFDWPRWPMIVPPLMVRDFNFSALIDAT
jgi:predicted Zn-dependent protease